MTFKTLMATAAMMLAASMTQAENVKIALNGVNDPSTNAEAAFVEGFSAVLQGSDFTVDVFPSGTLGKEKERFDQVAQGLIHVNLATLSTGYGMSPLMKGLALPFMFEGNDELDAVLESSDLVDMMNGPLLENGVRLSGINYIGVPMGIHNKTKPITSMDDLKGMRFRSLNSEMLAYQEAMGAKGTIIAWSEVANAIQTGIAEGYFNPPNSAIRTGHTEFLVHFTPVNIAPSARAVMISEDWYASLSESDQAKIDEAVQAGLTANRAWVQAWTDAVRARHVEAGVTISELAAGERDKMAAAASATWIDVMAAEDLAHFTSALEAVRN